MKMLGRDDHGFVDINAMALYAAINGSIFAEPKTKASLRILAYSRHDER